MTLFQTFCFWDRMLYHCQFSISSQVPSGWMASGSIFGCVRGTSSFTPFHIIVLNGSSGAKSRVKRLLAVLSAGIVGGPSSEQVAQHPALSALVSPSEFYSPAQL
jgi:hypothetical protein